MDKGSGCALRPGGEEGGERRIRVAIAEDHREVRRILAEMIDLQPDMEVVFQAADGVEALRGVEETSPDVVLVDMRMPNLGGVEVIEELRRRKVKAKIVAVSAYEDESYISEAIRRGADGYVLKGFSMRNLVEAVREAYRGMAVLPPEVAGPLARRYREGNAVLGALSAIIGEQSRPEEVIGKLCHLAGELLEAEEACAFRLPDGPGEGEKLFHLRSGEDEMSFMDVLTAADLKRLSDICSNDGRPVVCNDFPFSRKAEGVCRYHMVALPVDANGYGRFIVVCSRDKPFILSTNLLHELGILCAQAGMVYENLSHRERLSRLESRLEEALDVVVAGIGRRQEAYRMPELLKAVALFAGARGALFMVPASGEKSWDGVDSYNIPAREVVAFLCERHGDLLLDGLQEGAVILRPHEDGDPQQDAWLRGESLLLISVTSPSRRRSVMVGAGKAEHPLAKREEEQAYLQGEGEKGRPDTGFVVLIGDEHALSKASKDARLYTLASSIGAVLQDLPVPDKT